MTVFEFGKKLDFPKESFSFLEKAEKILLKKADILKDCKVRFFASEEAPWVRLDALAEQLHLHPYTVHLLFVVFCAEEGRKRFLDAGYREDLFWDAMKDARFKMEETKTVYDVWGVYCGWWFLDFLLMKRFCLGRLQFEIIPSEFACSIAGHTLNPHDLVINVHIPSFGPLHYEEVMDAYQRAVEFYGHLFPDGNIWFHCETWILYPPVNALLPQGNMKRFSEDFKIVHSWIDPSVDDRYRIFQVPGHVPMEQYPESNTLQRNLKAWLLKGNEMGISFGLFLWKDGRIIQE